MISGASLTIWCARLAFFLYAGALAAWITRRPRAASACWTAGLLVFLVHVAAAFHFYHHWSHAAAYQDTVRQTSELLGIEAGSGLYWNYVFTAVWAIDAVWMWAGARSYERRARWVTAAIHG